MKSMHRVPGALGEQHDSCRCLGPRSSEGGSLGYEDVDVALYFFSPAGNPAAVHEHGMEIALMTASGLPCKIRREGG